MFIESLCKMWLLGIALFFQFNLALASSPVELELLLNDRLREFIATEQAVSKSGHIQRDEKHMAALWNDKNDEDDPWNELSED